MDNLYRLLNIMERLRDPQRGCPWDLQQTFASILPYTIEEVYEVADAIDRQDYSQLQDELGDLLLQVVYYAQMAREQNLFDFDAIAKAISDKLVRRHPHVFDNLVEPNVATWEEIKQAERSEKSNHESQSILDDVPISMPQLLRAKTIQKRAATVEFDWQKADEVLLKVEEELEELKAEIQASDQLNELEEELGDLLFSVVNLSRHLNINAEEALRKSNNKFMQRFRYLENHFAQQGKGLIDCTKDEMELAWQLAKDELV